MLEGIIVGGDDHITVLVGEYVIEQECNNQSGQQRQYGRPRRFRRFRRRVLPLAALIALSLLPYPYYGSPYSYYGY